MPIPGPSEPLLDGDLELELAVHNGQTKSVRHVKHGGKLRFSNKKGARRLLIMSPAENPPFVVQPGSNPVSWFEVPAGSVKDVTLASFYEPDKSFTYMAQIDGSGAEDPIVIVDRR